MYGVVKATWYCARSGSSGGRSRTYQSSPVRSPIAGSRVADGFGVRDEFPQPDVRAVHADVLVDAHAGSGHLLQGVELVGVHAHHVVRLDQARGQRVAVVEREVVERPGREEAARQRTHRRSRRHVLVLGLGDDPGVLLHLRESGRSLGEERRDVLDEGVGGVNGVHALPDPRLDVGHVRAAGHLPGRKVRESAPAQLGVQFLAGSAHSESPCRSRPVMARRHSWRLGITLFNGGSSGDDLVGRSLPVVPQVDEFVGDVLQLRVPDVLFEAVYDDVFSHAPDGLDDRKVIGV